jgi:uncharacterized phage protein gp47/JayE
MAELTDFLPLFRESLDTIRARVDADVNAGIDPSDERYIDTTPGGFYHDISQAVLLEIERLWEALSVEVPAAAFPSFAFGEYLDEHGEVYGVERKAAAASSGLVRFTGAEGTAVNAGTEVAAVPADPEADPVSYSVTEGGVIGASGSLDLPVIAEEVGEEGNVPAGSATVLLTPVAGVTAVTNPLALTGGADVESDEPYRDRLELELTAPQGAGNAADYERWALAFPGVGGAVVQPVWDGPGTVRVVISDAGGGPVGPSVVAGLQALLDPVPGQGQGLAPINATVTVATPTAVPVPVAAAVTFKPGYSLDAATGGQATRAALVASVQAYGARLRAGDDVIKNAVEAQFFRVDGVLDGTVTAPAGNVAIGALETAQIAAVTLT